jgi:hypothetical protein
MTDQELAFHLGKSMEALGRIKGGVVAMKDTIKRELGDEYHSDDMREVVQGGLTDLETHLTNCYAAISDTASRSKDQS